MANFLMKQYIFKTLDDAGYYSDFGKFNFKIPSLRVSLVNKCNERCFYCHNEGISKRMPSIIQTGDIINTIFLLRDYGLKKIKLTGGEPLIYKDLKNLLYKIKHVADVNLYITTNGTLIRKRIKDLSPNIISKISVSLDTLDPHMYKLITGKDMLEEVLMGLNMLKKNGYNIEIDNILLKGLNTSKKSLNDIIGYCVQNEFDLQFIELSGSARKSYYLKYYADPYKVLQKNGLNFNEDKFRDRQFFKVKNSKVTLCRNINETCESSSGRRCGLRLMPNGALKNFTY
jgi:cyclic pyranopterin phosphate synthase